LQNREKLLNGSGLSPARRREALSGIARLQELSGDIEGAAKSWIAAAAAEPEKQDEALLRAGLCYAAMGEWEKALAPARTVFLNSQNSQFVIRARLLEAQIEAFFFAGNSASPAAGNGLGTLEALLEEDGYGAFTPSIYYTLWKLSGAETWKDRLIAEFPRSPESRIATGENSPAISAAPTPLWLLFPGRGGLEPAAGSVASSSATATETRPVPAATVPVTATAPAAQAPTRVLQAGLFSGEANAAALVERLRAAGFSPLVGRRVVNGSEYYTVNVLPGGDINKTIRELKAAGFDSFPVSN
jgi:tetratricopeptide (TPR) repeat protein